MTAEFLCWDNQGLAAKMVTERRCQVRAEKIEQCMVGRGAVGNAELPRWIACLRALTSGRVRRYNWYTLTWLDYPGHTT